MIGVGSGEGKPAKPFNRTVKKRNGGQRQEKRLVYQFNESAPGQTRINAEAGSSE